MSNPSYSNIDRWLFELMEGNLSPEQVAQLEAFLMQHPELDVDRDMWELAKVDSQEVVYPHQEKIVRRRPVGLYMSAGFASIALIIGIGIFNSTDQQSLQIAENAQFNGVNELTNEKSILSSEKSNKGSIQVSDQLGFENYNNLLVNNQTGVNTGFTKATSSIGNSFGNSEGQNRRINNNLEDINGSNRLANNIQIASVQQDLMQEKEDLDVLETKIAEQIEVKRAAKEIAYTSFGFSGGSRFSKTDYKMSFGSKMNKMARSIQKMLDNPVALKNTKDPYYHIPGMQAMDVNFGAVGTLLATRVQTVSRAQWFGQENQQFMNQLSVDGYSYGMRGGVGFQFNHNYYGQGGIENYHASLIYSPKFSVARNVIVEPSVRFKMGSKLLNSNQIETGTSVEYDRMNTQSFYANQEAPIGRSLWYKDLGLGLMVNTKWFYVGFQGDNLFEHYDNIYSNDIANPKRAGKHFVATIGTDYESKKENITVSPYCVYQQQEALSEGWLGVNLRYHWLTIGGAVSSNLEPAASIGLKFDHFMLTYNADITKSKLLNDTYLSHQVTIRFLTKPSRFGQRLLNQ